MLIILNNIRGKGKLLENTVCQVMNKRGTLYNFSFPYLRAIVYYGACRKNVTEFLFDCMHVECETFLYF